MVDYRPSVSTHKRQGAFQKVSRAWIRFWTLCLNLVGELAKNAKHNPVFVGLLSHSACTCPSERIISMSRKRLQYFASVSIVISKCGCSILVIQDTVHLRSFNASLCHPYNDGKISQSDPVDRPFL